MAAGIFIDLGNGIKGESTQIGFEDHIAALARARAKRDAAA